MTLQNITFCVRIFSPLQLYFSSLRAFFKIDNAVHYNYFWLIFLRLDGILGFLGQFFSSFLGKTGSGVFKWGVQLVKIALTSFDTFWRIAIEYLHKSFFFLEFQCLHNLRLMQKGGCEVWYQSPQKKLLNALQLEKSLIEQFFCITCSFNH